MSGDFFIFVLLRVATSKIFKAWRVGSTLRKPCFFNLTKMTGLLKSSEATMSSKEISELTGKQHQHVLFDCDKLNANYKKMNMVEISTMEIEHPTVKGRMIREMRLTKMQTFDLMTGYNIELRIKVNRRWEELEKKAKIPQTFSEALQLAADLQKQIELQAPKVENYDKFIDYSSLQSMKEVANMLGIGRNTFMAKLRELGILTSKNIPYQRFLDSGFFEVKESSQNGFNVATTYITPKGIDYLSKKIK